MRVLIIGYGNPLRGDDGIGPEVARKLAEEFSDPEIQVLVEHQLRPELAEQAAPAELVVFIDADTEGPPGQVAVRDVAPCPPDQYFTHQLDPATLLATTQVLYGGSPRGVLISVTGENFELSEQLSPLVRDAVPQVLGRVRKLLA